MQGVSQNSPANVFIVPQGVVCMRRLAALLAIVVLACNAAATCSSPPSLALVPKSTVGKAGTIRQYTLFVNNTNYFVWCDSPYYVKVSVLPREMRFVAPAVYPFIIHANPRNETAAFNLTFSLGSNSSDGSYPFTIQVYGKSFEGAEISSTVTGDYAVSGKLWD
jgi:hypothetical protein